VCCRQSQSSHCPRCYRSPRRWAAPARGVSVVRSGPVVFAVVGFGLRGWFGRRGIEYLAVVICAVPIIHSYGGAASAGTLIRADPESVGAVVTIFEATLKVAWLQLSKIDIWLSSVGAVRRWQLSGQPLGHIHSRPIGAYERDSLKIDFARTMVKQHASA
jgi:hypothetical protein